MEKAAIVIIIAAIFCFCGCSENQQDTVRSVSHKVGAIGIKDINQADSLKEGLPGYFGIDKEALEVSPGPGYSTVTIKDEDSKYSLEKIIESLKNLRAQNPKMNPIKVVHKTSNGSFEEDVN